MRRGRRNYTAEDYFNFLYDIGFDSDDYISLAKYLHEIEYEWVLRMDENRVYDGIEMRKYYLADELGYLPEDIDIDDEYIFGEFVSVLEVLVGFAFKICRDMGCHMATDELVEMFCENLKILKSNWEIGDLGKDIKRKIGKWMKNEKSQNIFGDLGLNGLDLWAQASNWLWNMEN